ncbi:MAG: ABC transporter substrate-binding protein [Prevotella sp.]|nr:ABC transporter substrate-binding protein [Prevotella sp.]
MHIHTSRLLLITLTAVFFASCKQVNTTTVSDHSAGDDTVTVDIQYAEGFKVSQEEGFRLLEITDPQRDDEEKEKTYRFALIPRGSKPQGIPDDCTAIETPVKGVICMTSLQLSGFLKLQALDQIVGIASAKRLFDKELKKRLEEGKIMKIGKEGNFDDEIVLASNPDAILVSLSKRGGFDKLEDSGIPLIPYMGYQETSPLAQAEWIKFVGLLTGKTSEANKLFDEIEDNYLTAKTLVTEKSAAKPLAFYGKMHGDNWYAMGGESFIAKIIADAGGTYFIDDDRTGGVNLDFERVYAQGERCDYWVIQNKGKERQSYENLLAEDSHYGDFRAFKQKKIICCDVSHTPVNELSPMEPDIVLKDFIKVFYPDVLTDYTPKYYQLIK